MKSLFKKASAFVLVLSSVAVAAGLISKDQVNQKVAALVAPFNNENTTISLSFTDLNVDMTRALDFGLTALISKKGTQNELVLALNNADYHFGNGWSPTMSGDISAKLDLVKVLGQEGINEYAQEFDQIVKSVAGDLAQKYGDAATVQAQISDLKKDAEGNIESATLRIAATIDFDKLPAGLNADAVEFKSAAVQLSVSRIGIAGQWKVVMNPLYSRFQADQPGLREFIEKLLNEDQEMYEGIQQLVAIVDNMADWLVNYDPSQQRAATR